MRSTPATARCGCAATTRSRRSRTGCAARCRASCRRRSPRSGGGGRERLAGGDAVVDAQLLQLRLGAAYEPADLLLVQTVLHRRDLDERVPERELALHARAQPLELEHPAERRVTRELVVGLHAAERLADLRDGGLQAVAADVEAIHD